jgi:hypothetical protein
LAQIQPQGRDLSHSQTRLSKIVWKLENVLQQDQSKIERFEGDMGVKQRESRTRTASRLKVKFHEPALAVALIFLIVVPAAPDPPSTLSLRLELAHQMVNRLRTELSIDSAVEIAFVNYHPLVFSVEPLDSRRQRFRISMEVGFLSILDDEELLGAIAHEMGHVWIYKNRPFLHTEQLANVIGQRVAPRDSLESVYAKLWAYEGTAGVPMEELLGPPRTPVRPAATPGDAN